MTRRRQRRLAAPSQNLDSFLDILTNTVGVLMFIGVFVSLLAVEADTIIRTPLVSNTRKSAQFFEVRGNRVAYIDKGNIQQQIDDFYQGLPTCYEPGVPPYGASEQFLALLREYQACVEIQAAAMAGFEAETKYYRIRLEPTTSGWLFEPLGEEIGEAPAEFVEGRSEFRQVLSQLDAGADYLAFIVRSDSFDAFRQARAIAWEAGFDVGWEPMNPNTAIVFGTSGRTIGVQ